MRIFLNIIFGCFLLLIVLKRTKEFNKRCDEIEKKVNLLSKRLDEEGERQIEEYRKAKDE